MTITLLVALTLQACTPALEEPVWPVKVDFRAPDLGPSKHAWTPKCEFYPLGAGRLAPLFVRVMQVCREETPLLEEAAAYEALFLGLGAVRSGHSELTFWRSSAAVHWHGPSQTIAEYLTTSTMRPAARCVGPMP